VLEALNVIQRELWEGKRQTSAVSRVTLVELCDDDNDAWSNINAEVEGVGVSPASVTANQEFIRGWIGQVIMEEADEDEPGRQHGESPPWPASATPPEDDMAAMTLASPVNTIVGNEPMLVETSAGGAQATSTMEHPKRGSSFSSHRSKDSAWRPFNGPNRDYVQGLLGKLLQLVDLTPTARDRIVLPAKRIFHQLDWRDRGFLFRPTIEDECRDAIQKAGISVSDGQLMQLVSDGDKNRDGRIDRGEFVDFIDELLSLVRNAEDERLQKIVVKDNERGIEYCRRQVGKIFEENPAHAILPWAWIFNSVEPRRWTLNDGVETLLESHDLPHITLRSFTVAAIVADRLCIRMLEQALTKWSEKLFQYPPELFDEYQKPIDAVLVAASRFAIFERDKSSSRWDSELDELHELASLVVTDGMASFEDCPSGELSKLRNDTFDVICNIMGFISAIGQLPDPGYRSSLPSIDDWRKEHIQTRASRINKASEKLLNAKSLVGRCQSWVNDHPSLSGKALDGLRQALILRAAQHAMMDGVQQQNYVRQLKSTNKVKITIVGARNLPKQDQFRA
jgi:hypothetical protein